MTVSTLFGVALIVAQATPVRHAAESVVACSTCEVESPGVVAAMVRLQNGRDRRTRDEAAIVLRHVDWRRHPEVLGALCYSLLHDRDKEVREEAAESLTRMRATGPVVHESLRIAAVRDPHWSTRIWARRGLRNMPRRCETACDVCETSSAPLGPVVVPDVEVIPPSAGAPGPFDRPNGMDEPTRNELEPLPPVDSRVNPTPEPMPPPAGEIKPLPDPEETGQAAKPATRTPLQRRVVLISPVRPWFFVRSR